MVKNQTMNKIIYALLLLTYWCSANAYGQNTTNAIDLFFQQYVENEDFTVVYISPKLIDMVGQLDPETMGLDDDKEGQAVMDMVQELQGIRILTTDITPDKYFKEAKARIDTQQYEPLMTVREKDGGNVDFLVREKGDVIEELLLLAGGQGQEFVLLSFVGHLSMDSISKLINAVE